MNLCLRPSWTVSLLRRPPQPVVAVRRGGIVRVGGFATAVGGGHAQTGVDEQNDCGVREGRP